MAVREKKSSLSTYAWLNDLLIRWHNFIKICLRKAIRAEILAVDKFDFSSLRFIKEGDTYLYLQL